MRRRSVQARRWLAWRRVHALAWLNQAVAAGYRDVAVLSRDLDSLGDRADFRDLIARLSQRR